jgi:hypothetical protein
MRLRTMTIGGRMSEHKENADLIATSTAENVGERLGLKYENVMSPLKALRIVIATVALMLSILWLQRIQTQWDLLSSFGALVVFVRLTIGSPMERQLTAESRQRLLEWIASEENQKEPSHDGTQTD